MTQCHFDFRDDARFREDYEGEEHATLEAAITEAVKAARELMAAMILNGSGLNNARFEVTTDDGKVVQEIWFRDLFPLD